MESLRCRKARSEDRQILLKWMEELWPGHTESERDALWKELRADANAVLLVAELDGRLAGFAQCQLRRDYVEGSSTSPVGYLEGIYVEPQCRKHGVARALVTVCEQWARQQGCAEFGSDCELENRDSWIFHQKVGFEEKGRIICFLKKL